MTNPGGPDASGWGPPPHGYGGQAPQPQGYGGQAPQPGGAPLAVVPRPSEVTVAFWLWVANIVLGIVSVAVTLLTLDDTFTAQVRDQLSANPDLRNVDAQTVVRAALVVGVVLSLLFDGAKLFLLFKLRSGRRWARTTLTVFGGLSILLTLVSLGSASVVTAGFGLAGAVLILAAIVFMFTGDARDYVSPRRKY